VDGDCEEDLGEKIGDEENSSEEVGGEEIGCEDRKQQNRAQEERKKEHQTSGADEPLLARLYARSGKRYGREGQLQAQGEADAS
jgi:hypothetical protein